MHKHTDLFLVIFSTWSKKGCRIFKNFWTEHILWSGESTFQLMSGSVWKIFKDHSGCYQRKEQKPVSVMVHAWLHVWRHRWCRGVCWQSVETHATIKMMYFPCNSSRKMSDLILHTLQTSGFINTESAGVWLACLQSTSVSYWNVRCIWRGGLDNNHGLLSSWNFIFSKNEHRFLWKSPMISMIQPFTHFFIPALSYAGSQGCNPSNQRLRWRG